MQQGYVPVEFPTKRYIKAFIEFEMGEKAIMEKGSLVGNKFFDVLQHFTNERKKEFSTLRYPCNVKIYIPRRTFFTRGANLNETNIINFNRFLELLIKTRMRQILDDSCEVFPSFEAHLPEVRKKLGIDLEAWSDDSMKKDYYRYRLDKGLPLLKAKNIYSRHVPPERACSIPF